MIFSDDCVLNPKQDIHTTHSKAQRRQKICKKNKTEKAEKCYFPGVTHHHKQDLPATAVACTGPALNWICNIWV